MFIKVSSASVDKSYYLNVNMVFKFEQWDIGTHIVTEDGVSLRVKETPEEIMKLIKEAKPPIVSFDSSNIEGAHIGVQVVSCCHESENEARQG